MNVGNRSNGYPRIPMDLLDISDDNVRKREITTDLDELVHSIDTIGLLQPIVVLPKGDRYQIIIGQRRFLAAKQLNWPDIPARIETRDLNQLEMKVLSFTENIQRRELSARDKADSCRFLLDSLLTIRAVAQHLGITEQTVRKWIGYAAVPEGLKEMVEEKLITRPVAVRISQHVTDEQQAVDVARKFAEIRPVGEASARFLDAVEEFPDRPVSVIERRAEETRVQTEITFVLPERWANAINEASTEMDSQPNDIAKDATIEWLEQRRY